MDTSELKGELERLHSASYGWALTCCRRDATEAEEVLQTVYLKILEGKARFRSESSLKTWLFAVIRKTAISEYRRSWLRSLRMTTDTTETEHRTAADPGPVARFEHSETQLQFQAALAALPGR